MVLPAEISFSASASSFCHLSFQNQAWSRSTVSWGTSKMALSTIFDKTMLPSDIPSFFLIDKGSVTWPFFLTLINSSIFSPIRARDW
ncbi:MAG: hypothetical protein A2W20_01230 [Candidatus Aminicenantes bacterium RBG_16_66_30]|nr:MAG: hypothetical protein A2W20_01230 [Candidatus Aminicenantes bacterium RBG_16_66_30]